ncbi:hypothetical protein J6590_076989 [Homalodisca vitripennis]|nr:hypothetical protein J6590_076989 [Homalodisca vitripennis]
MWQHRWVGGSGVRPEPEPQCPEWVRACGYSLSTRSHAREIRYIVLTKDLSPSHFIPPLSLVNFSTAA